MDAGILLRPFDRITDADLDKWLKNQPPATGKMEIINDHISEDRGLQCRYLDTKDVLSLEARKELQNEGWNILIGNILMDDGTRRHGLTRKTPATGV